MWPVSRPSHPGDRRSPILRETSGRTIGDVGRPAPNLATIGGVGRRRETRAERAEESGDKLPHSKTPNPSPLLLPLFAAHPIVQLGVPVQRLHQVFEPGEVADVRFSLGQFPL